MDIFLSRCPWWAGGVALGLLVVGLQWASNVRLGLIGAYGEVLEAVKAGRKSPLELRACLFVGVLIGAAVFGFLTRLSGGGPLSFAHGSFDQRFSPALAVKGPLLLLAGVLVGFGTRMAGGCTSGAGLCGIPRLSKGSAATTGSFVLVGMAVAQLINRFFPAGLQ